MDVEGFRNIIDIDFNGAFKWKGRNVKKKKKEKEKNSQ